MTNHPSDLRSGIVEIDTRRFDEFRREQIRQDRIAFFAGMLLCALTLAAGAVVVGLIEWGLAAMGL